MLFRWGSLVGTPAQLHSVGGTRHEMRQRCFLAGVVLIGLPAQQARPAAFSGWHEARRETTMLFRWGGLTVVPPQQACPAAV